MKILTMPQRSDEWYAARRQCIVTASEMGAFLVKEDQRSRDARSRMIRNHLCERLPLDDWTRQLREKEEKALSYNLDIQRGIELEESARRAFFNLTGIRTASVGICLHDSELAGCSPDGLNPVEDWDGQWLPDRFLSGLELKVPRRETHMEYLLNGGLPDDYRFQVHGSMAVTGLPEWHFMSWNEYLPPLHVVVKRDDFTASLEAAILSLDAERARAEAKLGKIWDDHNRKLHGNFSDH